ncbi:hypothetical protein M1M07_14125 [Rhodococcus sp. HM1]|uniref:hypothetical protein n=1 Tax=Rhodococcus sp. HM1 TaxID=2937759 RepID=UPI00200A3417|nr:hypothetical protein [Rhodococcus sp. HM1]MCK8672237.1 hypothetical protein [Rhodococcus sp. HM1]
MSELSFEIEVDSLVRTELVLDLPGGEWNPAIVVPVLTELSDKMLAQPHLDSVFRLVVQRAGVTVFDSAFQPLNINSHPDAILRGVVPRRASDGGMKSQAGMTLMIASAEELDSDRVRKSAWPVIAWVVGADANELCVRVHRECKPARTVADPGGSADRLALVCSRFLDEVAMSEQPDVSCWMDNRVSPITEGMGYVAG